VGRTEGPARLVVAVLLWLVLATGVVADDRAQLQATKEAGFGRLVLEFSDRLDLPKYKIVYDNNVLAVTFDEAVRLPLADMATTLPDYLTVGRVDPDGKGVRFGLRRPVTIHSMEAGEKLFIDLLPAGWQGLPPSMPPRVIAELAQRAKDAEILAEQRRKAEEARSLNPRATLHVGRNPTFYRVEFDWSTDTKAEFKQDGTTATINFDWPVAVDLYALKADLPSEIQGAANSVGVAGSSVILTLMAGVTPRFYSPDAKHFTLDIDLTSAEVDQNRTTAEAAAKAAEELAAQEAAKQAASSSSIEPGQEAMASDHTPGTAITPKIEEVSGTVRVDFPFERDTAAAVFRRGNALWMLFDTPTLINQPEQSEALSSIASAFTVTGAGETQVVRVDLSTPKLATLASEGRS